MKVNLKLVFGQFIGCFVLFALALFIPAATLAWIAGWVYLALFFGFYLAVNVWLFKHNPGLLQERTSLGRPGQKGWDKVLFPVLLVFPFALLAVSALDAVRFHWSSTSVLFQGMGVISLLISFRLLFLTFRENSFLSTVVRVQEDRKHSVVSTGPYHYVRHPMYSGFLIFVIGTPLLLGSWYGLAVGLIFMVMLAARAVFEERTLRDELHGYAEYMAQVKYRLIPYVW
jgi:protein-S-isoprenylcysteine O-methyltransferase Ste14